ADSATSATAAAIDAHLKAILAGTLPSGVDDLRAMQTHVQKLTDQLQKCTVGVTVGHAQGSGVIISKDGYVLTAAHVAGKANQPVTFNLSDGRELRGKTLGLNRSIDAGLMKIEEAGEYPFAEMGASETLKEGQWCLATGHPGGYQDDRGVVLRLGRVLFVGGQPQAITTDCTLVGGDSGGPLFDMDGRVIGINSRIANALSANMHVPVSTYKDTWDRLAKGDAWGHFPGQTPSLGVRGEEGSPDAKIAFVYPRSAAESGGIQVGDIVIKFNDQDIADFQALKDAVDQHEPGQEVTLQVKRGEELKDITLNLGRKRE
ncbi:MAG TPA: trypsin-like peptidase domain-containing protein, partial [Pirellulaceae bacterium]|nr:trypsin-like peptidase domain-containing protein [Pirellulaceae bacterium]